MKIVLHIGAHRTGTTTFQSYLRAQRNALAGWRVAAWEPVQTRKGLFDGVQPDSGLGLADMRRARGRVRLQLASAARRGVETLLVSDENLMGSVRTNLHNRTLYADVGERLARYVHAFGNEIDKVILSIRALDQFWASSAAFGLHRGHPVPDALARAAIATNPRSWQDVITDVACAVPGASFDVVPFENVAGHPDRLLSLATGRRADPEPAPQWHNRSKPVSALRALVAERGEDPGGIAGEPGARWMPFDPDAVSELRAAHARDLAWLANGADGLATFKYLTEETGPERAGHTPPAGPHMRGQGHDIEKGYLA